MALSNQIFELRKNRKLSQEQLGDMIGVTRQTISNWELGQTAPNSDQLKALSNALHISIDELLENDVSNIIIDKIDDTKKKTDTIYRLLIVVLVLVILILIYYLGTFFGEFLSNMGV